MKLTPNLRLRVCVERERERMMCMHVGEFLIERDREWDRQVEKLRDRERERGSVRRLKNKEIKGRYMKKRKERLLFI